MYIDNVLDFFKISTHSRVSVRGMVKKLRKYLLQEFRSRTHGGLNTYLPVDKGGALECF